MKSKRIALGIAGAALFIAIVVTSVWFLSPAPTSPKKLGFDQTIERIKNKEVSVINIKQDSLEIEDKNGAKFYTLIDGKDNTLGIIHKAADETGTKVHFEPAASGFGWILLINALPFYIMWGLTLAVIVYAVKVLSRNKG